MAGDDIIGTTWDRKYGPETTAYWLNKLRIDAMVSCFVNLCN